MVENGSTNNNSKVDSGLPYTLSSKTPAHLPKSNQRPVSHSGLRRNEHYHKKYEITRRSKDCTAHAKFHIPNVPGTQTGRVFTPYFQPQSAKRLCHNRTLSPNKCATYTRLSSASGLALQNRPVPSIFSFKNGEGANEIPTSYLQSRVVRNDLPAIRPEYITKSIYHTDQLDCTKVKRPMECQDTSLSRRFFTGTSMPKYPAQTREYSNKYTAKPRLANKFFEVYNQPPAQHSLFRCPMETLGQPEMSSKGKDNYSNRKSKSHSQKRKSKPKRRTKTSRNSELRELCRSSGTTKPSQVNPIYELTPQSEDKNTSTSPGCGKRAKMVDIQSPMGHTLTLPTSEQLSSNRCVRPSVGRSVKQSEYVRDLASNRASPSLQPERTFSYSSRSGKPSSPAKTKLPSYSMRQQNSSCTSPKGRRYEVDTPDGADISNIGPVGPISNTSEYSLPSRKVQQSGGSPITVSETSRVALNASVLRSCICEMGNSSNRSFCLTDCTCRQQLRVSRPERQSSPISRRVQCSMALPACVDIPTAILSPQSPDAPQSVNGNISRSSSPLAESILAGGPQSSSPRFTPDPERLTQTLDRHFNRATSPECRQHDSRGLEMWGWSEAVKTWNTEQLALLKNSWRGSTLKTYEIAWKRWVTWSVANNVNTKNPTGSDLAQFLSDLFLINKLAYNTILLHKSVVSTLCNAESSSLLSSHVLVKQVLKSIALKQPKTLKPPVWDVSDLVSFLSNYTVDLTSLFKVSRHAAILLLLCSGRRIHDLTLLTIDSDHYIKDKDTITLWPQFGSKTDNSNFSQSGWKLFSNTDNQNLNPVFWIEKTIELLCERRKSAKIFNLFVTIRGTAKFASRTVIAGWVKTLFKEANITAAPGSVRSAVASKSWYENHPLDLILARGNWRSAATFQKFYRREVISINNSENVTQLFNPVDKMG